MSDIRNLYLKEPQKRKGKIDRYSLKDGKIKSSYAREYVNDKRVRNLITEDPKTAICPSILNDARVVNLRKIEDGKQTTKQSNNEIQQSEINGDIMAVQSIPRTKSRRKRKETDSKRSDDESQNKEG